MAINTEAPWHKESFNRFIHHRLPSLLAERLPLVGYDVKAVSEYRLGLTLSVSTGSSEVAAHFEVPRPDAAGVFELDGIRRVVLPIASEQDLARAEMACVGEQLYSFIDARLGKAPADLAWDADLLRSFAPLDVWMRQIIEGAAHYRPDIKEWTGLPWAMSQVLHEPNYLARQGHLRRIIVASRTEPITPSQFGRVCPFETPEGDNIGRVLHIAVGAIIRDGRLVVADNRPEAALGLTASMVPFLEHNDPNRQLMGVNMMRFALAPPGPEPALVQTGNEPNAPDFWCGRNLLTAFMSLGADTFEDAIVVSESAASKLDFPHALEPGDWISNRHGAKGTISRILPDEQMPHLPGGTPVELVYSFIGLHTRLNFGQVREAVLGRIAKAEGTPAIVPPFHAPDAAEIRRRLEKAGLDESGMERLTLGRGGPKCDRPTTVGWVYWFKLDHLVGKKIHASVGLKGCNFQGHQEYLAMRDLGAFENIAETFNTRSVDHPDAGELAAKVAAGPVEQSPAPAPKFAQLCRAIAMAGISAGLDGQTLRFSFRPPADPTLALACPVPHPWMPERPMTQVGLLEDNPKCPALVEANRQLERLLAGGVPQALRDKATAQLSAVLAAYMESLFEPPLDPALDLLTREMLRFGNRVMFSGRSVLSVGADLRIDQVGLPDEIAWTLFGPLAIRETRDEKSVLARTDAAAKALDRVMAGAWVIMNRAPTMLPTSLLAFHPVRIPDKVVRLHPLACYMMNADFAGNQAAAFLPITRAGQEEAGRLLSVAGHLRRDPGLIRWAAPVQEMVWGLAMLSLTPAGRNEISELAGVEVAAPDGYVTRHTLGQALEAILKRDGVEAALDAAQRLMRRGFEVAKLSGTSMSPFMGSSLARPAPPAGDDPDEWNKYSQLLAERIASCRDFDSADIGPQLLAVKSGARGAMNHLVNLLGSRGAVSTFDGPAVGKRGQTPISNPPAAENRSQSPIFQSGVAVKSGWVHGLTPREMFACVVPARRGLSRTTEECIRAGYAVREAGQTRGFNVLARAMRSPQPGFVFAQAAAAGEIDPLTDLDSRLFVGLPVNARLERDMKLFEKDNNVTKGIDSSHS